MRPGGSSAFADVAKSTAAPRKGRAHNRLPRLRSDCRHADANVLPVYVGRAFADFDKLVAEDEATFKAAPPDAFKTFDEKLISAETYRMQLNPQMSYVPKDVRESDPGILDAKEATAPKATTAAPKTTTQN